MKKLNLQYSIKILGRIWQGGLCTTGLCFAGHEDFIPSAKDIKVRSGDFESIRDYEIEMLWQTADTYASDGAECIRDHSKIVKAWDSEDNAERFHNDY